MLLSASLSIQATTPTSIPAGLSANVGSVPSGRSSSVQVHDTASSILEAASVTASSPPIDLRTAASPLIVSFSSDVAEFPTTLSRNAAETLSSGPTVTSSVSEQLSSSSSIVSDAAVTGLPHAADSVSSAKHATSPLSSGVSSVADRATASVPTIVTATNAVLSPAAQDADIDLDAFYADLGLSEVLSGLSHPTADSASSLPVNAESEEEKAERERLREVKMAEKRSNIMSRHSEWEQRVAASIETNTQALRQALAALRKSAAIDLKESVEIRAEIDGLVEEAEKYLRGAEKYFQTLNHEGRTDQEKRAMWERVTDKVDEKFAERLVQTEAIVNGWYLPILDKELAEVRKATEAVRDVADRAQADIGMDYAYLDDVTYKDWQRYHDLLRKSDNFTGLAQSIQNGSDPSPLSNPVLDEMTEMQSDVQDIVLGFETRLRRIRRNGERILADGQQTQTDPRDDESVSILPIEDGKEVQHPAAIDIPPVVIGRSKEEVVDALNRVVEQDGQATSSPQVTDEPSDPESAVRSLVEDRATDQNHIEPQLLREEL